MLSKSCLFIFPAWAVLAISATQALSSTEICDRGEPRCQSTLRFPGGGEVSYYRSHPLSQTQPRVTRAVIVIHGALRNADEYFETMLGAVQAGNLSRSTLVIAPHLKTLRDKPAPDELCWDSSGWKQGDLSVSEGHARRSSFEVVDALIRRLVDPTRFPSLRTIVITGHSAGGQFVQRFASATGADSGFSQPEIRYVVSNPSSYLYLNQLRPVPGAPGKFELPSGSECQDSYDDYRYGLRKLNEYLSRSRPAILIERYTSRNVVYLLGEKDNDPADPDLDDTCPAALQGAHRLERGQLYYSHLRKFFPWSRHQLVTVPGVGHDAVLMYQSIQGRDTLFAE